MTKFNEGGMWENPCFEIKINVDISRRDGSKPCRHCVNPRDEPPEYYMTGPEAVKGRQLNIGAKIWECPRVVVAENECGYNSTGVCLDCIIEASLTLAKGQDDKNVPLQWVDTGNGWYADAQHGWYTIRHGLLCCVVAPSPDDIKKKMSEHKSDDEAKLAAQDHASRPIAEQTLDMIV